MAVKKGGGANANTDLKREDKLQAVVLADVCARKLRPATFDGPKALMPLANVPLLEYTLEFLCAGGIEEVFVFACHGAEAIEAYLRAVESRFAPAVLRCIASRAPCFSAGDALREVFEANVIQADFVLMPADVVTNLSLPALIQAHRAARDADKNTLLTACFARVPHAHRIRGVDDGAALVLDARTGRLAHYEPLPAGLASGSGRIALPLELLDDANASAASLAVRLDLLDTRIDVCTLEVLTLLVDNFDWGELRADMLVGVLGSDILGKTVYVHELGPASVSTPTCGPFAARAHDWRTYAELTADVLSRWSFPLVPDSNLLSSMDAVAGQPEPVPLVAAASTTYRQSRGNIYAEGDVALARSAAIGARVLLGGGSSVGADARVTRSVVGRRCTIEDGATIVDSVLWAGVRVCAGATVRGAVLCEAVVVGAGATVGAGCVVGRGVVVGAGVILAPRTLYTKHAPRASTGAASALAAAAADADAAAAAAWAEGDEASDDDFSDDDAPAAGASDGAEALSDAARALGHGGAGFLYGHSPAHASFACARPRPPLPTEPDDSDDGDEGCQGEPGESGKDRDGFLDNALDILVGMLEDGNAVDNVVLEVNALKFAYNRSVADCAAVSLRAVLAGVYAAAQRVAGASADAAPARKPLLAQLKKAIARWSALLRRYVTSDDDQADLIASLESLSEPLPWSSDVFQYVVQALYESDVLDEESIVLWADEAQHAPPGSGTAARRAQCEAFLTWLAEAEESDDDDDDDDDDDVDDDQ